MGSISHDVDIAAMRKEYADAGLREADLAADPVAMFERWFADALAANLHEPNAMVLATASAEGRPSSRMVLLKGFGRRRLPLLHQHPLAQGRRPRGQPARARCSSRGTCSSGRCGSRARPRRLSAADVAAYFDVRPRGSQLGAWASHQSRPVADRDELEAAYDEVAARYPEPTPVPVPEEWGGYVVRPEVVEFWQGRPGRMHDRLAYTRSGDSWTTQRLAP